jgi:hypothetical protein
MRASIQVANSVRHEAADGRHERRRRFGRQRALACTAALVVVLALAGCSDGSGDAGGSGGDSNNANSNSANSDSAKSYPMARDDRCSDSGEGFACTGDSTVAVGTEFTGDGYSLRYRGAKVVRGSGSDSANPDSVAAYVFFDITRVGSSNLYLRHDETGELDNSFVAAAGTAETSLSDCTTGDGNTTGAPAYLGAYGEDSGPELQPDETFTRVYCFDVSGPSSLVGGSVSFLLEGKPFPSGEEVRFSLDDQQLDDSVLQDTTASIEKWGSKEEVQHWTEEQARDLDS